MSSCAMERSSMIEAVMDAYAEKIED
ncbi:hypothetical protein A2U01_0053305, partial [Trifolium medium]|nr:hypothetical protein [Trifolium medium]